MKEARIVSNLNLDWKFSRGDEPKAWYKGHDDSEWRDITLPHDWSVEEPFSKEHSSGTGYVAGGTGWYRKNFKLPSELKGKKVYITFEGIYNNSQVWCNSYYIGKRPFGYSTFTYDITDFVTFERDNVISVKVNHKDIADSRWFTGSGIYRDVYLTITDPIHIDQYGVFVTTPEVSVEQATVAVNVQLTNETSNPENIQIKNTLLDQNGEAVGSSSEITNILAESNLHVDQSINVKEPQLWSPENPYLYTVKTEIIKNNQVIDNVTTVTGIRSFSFDPKKGFFLNDENMKIKGVCVHHDAGGLGAAVPKKVWVRRLKALKEMGCNAIRMSHNPPASNLLDLCDSMGFLVMDEAFDEWEGVKNKWFNGHNVYPPKHYGYYEDFPQWGETDLKEMVLRDRNHPSIIMWSIGNEIDYPNDPYCHPSFETMTGNNDSKKPAAERIYDPNKPNAERLTTIAKRLVQYVKECDTTRPVTSALAFPELSNLTGYAQALDVVGYNYKEHLYEDDLEKYPDHVIYGSENKPGYDAWLKVRDNDAICAQFIWTGIDYLGEAKGWPVRAAPAGFLDLAGNKKSSYYYRQSFWSKEPMVYLAAMPKYALESERNPRWQGDPHWNWKDGEELAVFCYTNCQEAELFLNDKSLGTQQMSEDGSYLSWDIAFEKGVLKVVAKDRNGNKHTHELVTASAPKKLDIEIDYPELKADGQDITHMEMQITDENGNPVYLADNRIELSVEGPGELIGMESGNVKDLQTYNSNNRKAYQGKLVAFLRSKTEEGTISVTVKSEGLETTQLSIPVKKEEKVTASTMH
ncbi:glycoside hydrolase family 2 TIM barrel-domain containing protein [Gracilibacillus sp. YIM 98692]|uniref:glycoside hydrolase family 2 TIM barrel-domain containing protein n=1 Tax=Gracilibacillus sp. YIM 98692 TaxID=2663532 RepID=UPI0013D04C9E|nr:glycoside hydrolase family 2 TIM barrel-domain containing protein [Gracilibacillus sp. YIM 98692]